MKISFGVYIFLSHAVKKHSASVMTFFLTEILYEKNVFKKQIKIKIRYHLTPIQTATVKEAEGNKSRQRCCALLVDYKMV